MVGTSNPSVLERFPWSHGALDKKRPGTMATQRWSWPWKLVKTSKTSVPWRKNVGRLVVNTWENVGWFLVNGWIFLSWTVRYTLPQARRGYCFAGRASKIPCSPRIFVRSNARCRSYLDIFKMATSNESNEFNMAPDWKLGRSPPKSSHGDWKPSPGAEVWKMPLPPARWGPSRFGSSQWCRFFLGWKWSVGLEQEFYPLVRSK